MHGKGALLTAGQRSSVDCDEVRGIMSLERIRIGETMELLVRGIHV